MATFARRNGRVTATVRIRPHPSQSKTFDTLRDAKLWAKEVELRLHNEQEGNFSHITFRKVLERYRDEEIPKLRSRRVPAGRIEIFLRSSLPVDLPIGEVTKYHLIEWRDSCLSKLKGSSVTRDMGILSAAFSMCVKEWGYLKTNPLSEVARPASPPHRERIITQAEIDAMLVALGHEDGVKPVSVGRQVAVAFLLALETGMRAGEIVGMEWGRVRLDERKVALHTTKNGRAREVPLSLRAVALLRGMEGINDVRVFVMTAQTLDAYFRKARKQAGLDGFTFHDSRHTAATRIVRATKIDVLSLCKMFGWSDPKRAMTYFNPTATEIAEML